MDSKFVLHFYNGDAWSLQLDGCVKNCLSIEIFFHVACRYQIAVVAVALVRLRCENLIDTSPRVRAPVKSEFPIV